MTATTADGLPVPRFSNPDQLAFPGLPLGIDGCTDNAKTLRQTITVASKWRDGTQRTVIVQAPNQDVVARIYEKGLIVLKGQLTEEASPEELAPSSTSDLIVADSDEVLARLEAETGNLYIKGRLRAWVISPNITPKLKLLRSSGDISVGLTPSGNLYAAEKILIQNSPSP